MIHLLFAVKITRQDDKQPMEPSEGNSPSDCMKEGTCLASSCGIERHVCGNSHCLKKLNEQHRQLAKLYGRLSMSDTNGMELIADCHRVTEVNLTAALGFCSMTSSIESLVSLERAHELVTSLSVEVFPGALRTEQKIGSWRESLENEMNLKHSEGYHKTVGSKYLVVSSGALYCKCKYPTHPVVIDARTQHRLIDQLFSVPKCVRLARMSEKSHELLTKILQAVPERSRDEMEEIVGEDFMKWGEGNISDFQRKKAKRMMSSDFPTIDEKDSWGAARTFVDMLQKFLEDSEMGEQEPEAME